MIKHADGNILPGKPVFILCTVLKDVEKIRKKLCLLCPPLCEAVLYCQPLLRSNTKSKFLPYLLLSSGPGLIFFIRIYKNHCKMTQLS